MAGVLFIVNVPRQAYEEELMKKEKTAKIYVEKNNYENTSKIVDELKENKRFGSLRNTIESFAQNEDNIGISKCKSTDCLHSYDKEVGLYKSKSENTLDVNKLSLESERKSYMRTSWEGLKQAIKPSRNKVKITSPGSAVDILADFHWETPLETILSEVLTRLAIENATWNSTKENTFWQVIFSLESGNLCEELLQVLRTFGIGSRHQTSVSVIPCALYYRSSNGDDSQASAANQGARFQSDADTMWSRFSSSVRARNNLAQVLNDVRADAALTFDWLFLLIVAAFVAAIGLVENSTVILVASMLISPLMGPITAGTLGTAVRDRSLQQMGVMHEMLGLFLSLVIGFVFGLAICAVDERYGVGDWPTYEMTSRCEIRSLWVGVMVAIPSGAGVALAVLGEYTASLVGVAISASLLPPAVNAGLLWAMALVHLIFLDDDTRWTGVVKTAIYSTNHPTELAVLGTVSLCLTLVNIICIFLAGVVVYKVKEVCPLERKDISWWKRNKNVRGSIRNFPKEDSTIAWELYTKWCNETDEKKKCDKKDTALSAVQSDTVTFRRNQPMAQRLRAQNIEDYCHRRAQMIENYMPLDVQTAGDDESNNDRFDDSLDKSTTDSINNNVNKGTDNDNKPSTLDFDSRYSFYNMGFEELDRIDKNKTLGDHSEERPTIEPSLSFTVDPKKYGIVLGSQSFDV